jgi:mono/diheme cytochrome c family protein
MISRSASLLVALAVLAFNGCSRQGVTPAAPAAPTAATAATAATADTPGNASDGKKVYLRVCLACHQPTGLGLPGAFPPLVGSAIVTEPDPGKIIRIAMHGLQGPIKVKGTTYNSIMPTIAPPLTDKEITDVLTHIRSEWSDKADSVSVEVVARIRGAEKSRGTPWTWAELAKP